MKFHIIITLTVILLNQEVQGIATLTPTEIVASIGDNVTFTCTSSDVFAEVSLTPPLADRITEDPASTISNKIYTLRMITAEDGGLVISCRDGTPNQMASITFDVLISPKVTFSQTAYQSIEGVNLTITGNVTGNRDPTSVWSIGNTVITDNLPQLDVSNNAIAFSPVQRGDMGTYTINSTNSEGSAIFTFSLDVFYLDVPNLMRVNLNVSENELFTFNCSDSGSNPSVTTITLTLPDNTRVSVSSTSKSIPLNVTQEGMYTCTISNGELTKSRVYVVTITTTDSTSTSSTSPTGLTTGAVAGIAVGIVLLVVIVIVVAIVIGVVVWIFKSGSSK